MIRPIWNSQDKNCFHFSKLLRDCLHYQVVWPSWAHNCLTANGHTCKQNLYLCLVLISYVVVAFQWNISLRNWCWCNLDKINMSCSNPAHTPRWRHRHVHRWLRNKWNKSVKSHAESQASPDGLGLLRTSGQGFRSALLRHQSSMHLTLISGLAIVGCMHWH